MDSNNSELLVADVVQVRPDYLGPEAGCLAVVTEVVGDHVIAYIEYLDNEEHAFSIRSEHVTRVGLAPYVIAKHMPYKNKL